MLSFYVVFMAHHIKPTSVVQYLSGIINCLQLPFPSAWAAHHDLLVNKSLMGMQRLHGFVLTSRKRALTTDDLHTLVSHVSPNGLDNLVLIAIVFTAFHALLHLNKITQPDNVCCCSSTKITMRHTIIVSLSPFSFFLPTHKTDRFFEGNTIAIEAHTSMLNPCPHFTWYLALHDHCFPFHPQLWLHTNGQIPTYSWVVQQLKQILSDDVAGHSMESGGATALMLAGIPDDHIQARWHWSSDTYCAYIQKHPVMLQALLHGCSTFDDQLWLWHSLQNHLTSYQHLQIHLNLLFNTVYGHISLAMNLFLAAPIPAIPASYISLFGDATQGDLSAFRLGTV